MTPEVAFRETHDYARRKAWDPFIRTYRFLDGPAESLQRGSRVWVRAHNGLTMTVAYEALDPPNFVAMQMTQGPWFFRKFTGSWRFSRCDEGARIAFRYGFTARPGLLTPILRWALQRDMTRRVEALQTHLATLTVEPVAAGC